MRLKEELCKYAEVHSRVFYLRYAAVWMVLHLLNIKRWWLGSLRVPYKAPRVRWDGIILLIQCDESQSWRAELWDESHSS